MAGASCPYGKGVDDPDDCRHSAPRLLHQVERAMDLLIQQQPRIFDLTRQAGARAYRVVDGRAYLAGLVANLVAAGLCAEVDLDDTRQSTIRVKDSAVSSEDYDVITTTGFMRRGPGAYRMTCVPPSFPVDRPAQPAATASTSTRSQKAAPTAVERRR